MIAWMEIKFGMMEKADLERGVEMRVKNSDPPPNVHEHSCCPGTITHTHLDDRKLFVNRVSAYATRRYGEENDDSNQAWDLLKHDLVDVTRQVLQNLGTSLYVIIVDAYRSKNISSFQNNAALMLDLLTDLDNVLSSNQAFLLGTWLESAKALATTPLVRHQCSDK
uniref:Alpha-N-acetylglucosaminidase C-terminal domain-containing protein n=1 Tax=Timema bartmani TaxID=61472 RepID=A0A7R9EUD6_9NEOP|nr:unnamed protein product [Timema bartmani]